MTDPGDLETAVCRWLKETNGAREAAEWILEKAEATGEVPKQPTCPFSDQRLTALAAFFSTNYVRSADSGNKCKLFFESWENEVIGTNGLFLPTLASACGQQLRNRRHDREARSAKLELALKQHESSRGLPGFVAARELQSLADRKGRFWYRSAKWDLDEIQPEVERYFNVLAHVEILRGNPSMIERVVHVSRHVAGDTHWLRPGNQVWKDLAADVLDFDPMLAEMTEALAERERTARVLSHIGITENLTSVTVLSFGRFAIERGGNVWNWPTEAAAQYLPVWYSAQHLAEATLLTEYPIERVISVENETSFLDLIELHSTEPKTILVYTEGHANRAVVHLLRLIAQNNPQTEFHHQGDLDLFGVRILASLAERTGLSIKPMFMDVATHERFEASGIRISQEDRDAIQLALNDTALPCRDLLTRIADSGKRVEQESITAHMR